MIVVDTRAASYPLTIKPLLTSPSLGGLEPSAPNVLYGIAVSGAGDVDGDGFDDVLVGANAYDNPDLVEGSALPIWARRPAPRWSRTYGLTSRTCRSLLGWSVDGAGDVDGDNYSDVVVGAPEDVHW